ncbi:peptidase inhibitor 16 isoform X1 [Rousettus aegyptiacus]|nr:peptidase inhibitor 16 isoform X1 [Rousettus aegyptiacus]XP_036095406.1 peptidase inhibitor 16 isoform X1 [Rousettus aegyptiacus]XP_036095410.1 peptidase inhibitor 16 isoform X1 [Rousettus aegyptiacus]XP_036095412.1 peptidase inhibitor 16 isoform X1 [Rousettus aegyptiacus]
MHSSRSLLALLLLPLLLLAATTGLAGALSDDEKRVMVELHNLYRAQVSPPAANMLQMRWDEELAAFAKAYAQECVWGHNKERGRRGENLFAITDEGMDVPLAVEEWYLEREHYNLSTATCDPGQMCGHYTQVVWAKTERIGCGAHFCEKLQGVEETNIHLLVCNYEPPGNVKGQKPYQEGHPCSQCPSGYRCENSVCEPIRGPEESQDLPYLVTEAPSSSVTEASDSRKASTSSFLTTETPFLVTEVSDSLATKALPAVETTAPSSLATEGPSSMATDAPPSLTTEDPSFIEILRPIFLDEGPATSPKLTQDPVFKLADKEASRTRMSSRSPKSSLHPKMSLTGTQEPLSHSQEEGKAEAESPLSSEVLVSVSLVQNEPGELSATLDHLGDTLSKSLLNFPDISATTNILAQQLVVLAS